MLNILNSATFAINNTLIKQQPILIKNYAISNVEGSATFTLINEINIKAHIQPFTPREIKKYTEATIDSAFNYKFFLVGKNAYTIYSNNFNLKNSLIIWDNQEFRSFGIRDWSINGWVCIYASLKDNLNNGGDYDKNI